MLVTGCCSAFENYVVSRGTFMHGDTIRAISTFSIIPAAVVLYLSVPSLEAHLS